MAAPDQPQAPRREDRPAAGPGEEPGGSERDPAPAAAPEDASDADRDLEPLGREIAEEVE